MKRSKLDINPDRRVRKIGLLTCLFCVLIACFFVYAACNQLDIFSWIYDLSGIDHEVFNIGDRALCIMIAIFCFGYAFISLTMSWFVIVDLDDFDDQSQK